MRTFKNMRAVADRIRAATQSLNDPDDVAVIGQYLQELEDLAREQEAEDGLRLGAQIPLDADVHLAGGDDEAETEIGSTVAPLTRTHIRGYLRTASPSEEHAGQWVLRLGQP